MTSADEDISHYTINWEKRMNLDEIIEGLNAGEIKIVKIRYKRGDGYYAGSFGKDFPKTYDVVSVQPGKVVYKIGGKKKAQTPGKGVYYRVPARAKPREGYAIAEIKGEYIFLYFSYR